MNNGKEAALGLTKQLKAQKIDVTIMKEDFFLH